VEARPHYLVLGNDRRPEQTEASLLKQFSEHSVWLLPNSLPFAFLAQGAVWSEAAAIRSELTADEVRTVQPSAVTPNRVELVATAEPGDVLVLLQSAFDGWQLEIDDKATPPEIVGGYLAVTAQPGQHRYEFTFRPRSFFVGLCISAATIGIIVLWLAAPALSAARQHRKQRFRGVFRNGVFVPDQPVILQEGTSVRLTVEPLEDISAKREHGPALRVAQPGWILFGMSLAVYVFTRLWGIARFPIYFFTDEATFALFASELLSRGLRDGRGTLLPLYFEVAGNRWTPVLAVYAHLPAVALFGRSILAVRATSAIVTILAPVAVALILKSIFRIRYWWAGALLVAIVPTWFLHSRTAFEWMMMASFYACFILCYLLYRTRSPRYLYAAILFGAATFYNHASGQLVMAAAAILLTVSDFRYHLRNWRTVLLGLLMIALLAVPFLRLRIQQPQAMLVHLRAIDSYWFRDIPLVDKLRQFASTYLYGLSPSYWFQANAHDLVRHRMRDYGNLGLAMLPLVLAGALLCLRRVRSSVHRAILLTAIAAPAGAAMADVAITRMMAFIPPICVIAGLGLDLILEWVRTTVRSSRLRVGADGRGADLLQTVLASAVFVTLSGASLWMLRDALANGPTWYTDYGLYGMQYGARELFAEAIPQYLSENPDATVLVSPNWANGADTFIRFFLPPDQQFSRVQMHDVSYFMDERRELSPNMVFVMTSDEYAKAKASPKFSEIDVEKVVPYPDGRPGFYFARLAYSENVDALMAQEREERRRPVVESVDVQDQTVSVTHSPFDGGQLRNLFDGDPFTLARGLEANPLVLEFEFRQAQQIGAIAATFGNGDYSVEATFYREGGTEPTVVSKEFRGLPPDPRVVLSLGDRSETVKRLRLALYRYDTGEPAHVHVRELEFLPSPE
jgi:4-amino-4-deoxy-L-arabinose transferase-like glycosyltransferase